MAANPRTLFLSTDDVACLVQSRGLPACLDAMAQRIAADYLRWAEFDLCPRTASHSRVGVIELMPISDARTYAFKYVNGHPLNHRVGLPTVMAFGVLADVATGHPYCLSELTLTTALRTAATSVVAARALARPGSRTMALIGNGAQAEFQALAFHHLMGIEEVRLFDTDPAATHKLMRNLSHTRLRLTRCASSAQAVRGADIVTTATACKAHGRVLTADMLEAGMHINAIGGDCPGKTELEPAVLQAAHVVVEYEAQTRIEGDVQQLSADFPVTPLWQVLDGTRAGRSSAREVTMFDSVGFALEDFSALAWLHEAALARGLGRTIELVPPLRDPKNLFELLQRPAAQDADVRGATHARLRRRAQPH